MSRLALLGLALAVVLLAGCSQSVASLEEPAPAGQIARGQAVFQQPLIKQTPGCATCHSLEPGVVVVGPSLAGVGTRAEKELHSAEYKGLARTSTEFLRESILTPQRFLSGGFSHSVMPEWEGVIERQDLNDLVAFLASLK